MAKTVPKTIIATKRLSEGQKYTLKFNFDKTAYQPPVLEVAVSQYIACIYDHEPWIGVVTEVDEEYEDVRIKFLHPGFQAVSYQWPQKDDICWVPNIHLLCKIAVPSTTTTGRKYKIDKEDQLNVSKCYERFSI